MISWKICECLDGDFIRIKRPWWARIFFPSRQMFICTRNGQRMLVHPQAIKEAEWIQRARHREFLDCMKQKGTARSDE